MTDLDALGRRRQRAKATFEALTAEVKVAALEAIAGGASEKSVSELLQVDRMTIRKWQGKR